MNKTAQEVFAEKLAAYKLAREVELLNDKVTIERDSKEKLENVEKQIKELADLTVLPKKAEETINSWSISGVSTTATIGSSGLYTYTA